MRLGQFEMEIMVNGKPIKEYHHRDQIWVEGRIGSNYSIRLTNQTIGRILAVVSVDGLSVMDGQPARHDSGGYVLQPNQTSEIPGWRRDNDNVAKFEFAKVEESYAAQTDQAGNIGVIGCAFFTEYISHISPFMRQPVRRFSSDIFGQGALKGLIRQEGIGTGYGDEAQHRVATTTFNKASQSPTQVFTIRYADRVGLLRAGIDLRPTKSIIAVPDSADPFPGEIKPSCPPPPGWRPKK